MWSLERANEDMDGMARREKNALTVSRAFDECFASTPGFEERQPGIVVAPGDANVFGRSAVEALKVYAAACPNGRARILLHGQGSDALHEMVIAAPAFTVWPPLLNDRAPQSWFVLDGELAFVRYKPHGEVVDLHRLSSGGVTGPFFLRFSARDWYTTVPMSEMTVYLETKRGPHGLTTFADWGPQSNTDPAGMALIEMLSAAFGTSHPDS